MDDPMAIATRYATIARKMVNDVAEVAIDAFNKIDDTSGSTYSAEDAIESVARLASIAVTGGSALARIPLQIQPNNGPMLVADQVASVVARALSDGTAVAGDAAQKANAGTLKDNWVDSAVTLTGMAMLRAAEAAEAIGAGPGLLADPEMRFGPYVIQGADAKEEVVLKMAHLGRPGVDEDIAGIVRFEPDGGVLKAGRKKREFWLTINTAGIPSGIYRGTVIGQRAKKNRSSLGLRVTVNL